MTPTIRYAHAPARLLAGIRAWHAFESLTADARAQWQQLEELLPLPGQLGEGRYGVMCATDLPGRRLEYMCAVEVADLAALPTGTGKLRLPAAYYAVFSAPSSLATLPAMWQYIWQEWLPNTSHKSAPTPDFEQYGLDPVTKEPAVEIWVPVLE